jgi:hypothetical protein
MNARNDICRDTQRATWKVVDVDRDAGTISERVTVRETGEIIVDRVEPLDAHRGRGTARSEK